MRQDPNVIMVGEIRDEEVAQIVGQAAYTGHLVLSSVHTVDAATAVTRLTNLGLEAYKVAESLAAVLAQRLFRVGEIPQVGVPAYTRVDARVERPLTRALTAAIAGQNCSIAPMWKRLAYWL
jgi:type II secretory ATPase GspE/PulE/Tfp pilus assembly ATPase PilB-like protein